MPRAWAPPADAAAETLTPFFAELFSGAGRVAAAARRAGYCSREWEIKSGPAGDLLRRCVEAGLMASIRNGLVLAVMLGPPCTSFSVVQNVNVPLRSRERPRGLANLPEPQRVKVDLGNQFLDLTIRVIKMCVRLRVPFCLEHPHSSYMWHDPALQAVLLRARSRTVMVNHCSFNSPHRKATRLAFGGGEGLDLGILDQPGVVQCSGRHGFCFFSGKKHVILEGRSAREAAAYPPKLAAALAKALLSPIWSERGRGLIQ